MEIWKAIEGYFGYEVSSLGRVKSLSRKIVYKNGIIANQPEKILSPEITKKGYKRVSLSIENVVQRFSIHRLVAEAFLTRKEEYDQVNHKDGNKTNNNVDNLEWCSGSENLKHAFKEGLKRPTKGEGHGQSKVTWDDVNMIRSEYVCSDKSANDLAKEYGLSTATVSEILRNEIWYDKNYTRPTREFTKKKQFKSHLPELIPIVKQLFNAGISTNEIAKIFKKDKRTIERLLQSPIQ